MRSTARDQAPSRTSGERSGGVGQSKVLRGLAVLLVAVLVPLWVYHQGGGNQAVATTAGDGLPVGSVTTPSGPLTQLDREFVTKVRLAGLWEMPAGMMSMTHTKNPKVQASGQHLIDGHQKLDDEVLKIAPQLGMGLPNQPNADQQGWLQQMDALQDADFDRTSTMLLRRAHGQVFQLVAKIRATTRNTLVRQLADSANTTVADHITMLEATGLVDFNTLAAEATKPPKAGAPLPPGVPVGQAAPVMKLSQAWDEGSVGVAANSSDGTGRQGSTGNPTAGKPGVQASAGTSGGY